MNKSLGAIVLGTSFGVVTHVRALRQAGFEVKALVGRDAEKTKQRAADADIPLGTTDYAEALALPGVDMVTIATPPHTHCALVEQAAAAGKHIVCEKPFAKDIVEAERMLAAVQDAGVVHAIGTEWRYSTGQAVATKAVRDGLIGEPQLLTHMMMLPMLAMPGTEVPEWWADAEHGGGWLGAFASHRIDQIQDMLGPICGVNASLRTLSPHGWSSDDSYTVQFQTESGVDGMMQSSAAAVGDMFACFRLVGSKGTLIMEGEKVIIADATGKRELEPTEEMIDAAPVPPPSNLMHTTYDMFHSMGIDLSPYTKLFNTVAKTIRGEAIDSDIKLATFEDGVALQKVMDAIRISDEERCWIDIVDD